MSNVKDYIKRKGIATVLRDDEIPTPVKVAEKPNKNRKWNEENVNVNEEERSNTD